VLFCKVIAKQKKTSFAGHVLQEYSGGNVRSIYCG